MVFLLVTLSSKIIAADDNQPLFYQELNASETNQAKIVSSFVTQLRRSNLDAWTLKQLKRFKSSELLPSYETVYQLSSDLSSSKTGDKYFKVCGANGDVSKWKPLNNVETVIAKEFASLCKVKFLENLITSKKFKSLTLEEKDFFEKHSRFFLLKDRRHLLKRYLKLVERDSEIHNFISRVVTDAYIKFDIIAEKELVALLDIGNDLTGHIQSSGLRGLSGKILFESEFRALIRKSLANETSVQKTKESVEQVISFQQQNKNFIRQHVAWVNFIMVGRELSHLKMWDVADTVIAHANRIAKGATQIHESQFQALFLRVLKGDTSELYSFIDKNKLLKKYDQLSSKLQFWIAYSLENHGKKKVSSRLYERLLTTNPLSFYSIVAQREYQILNNKTFVSKPFVMPNITKAELSDDMKSSLKRLRLWIKVNDHYLARNEISELKNTDKAAALNKALDKPVNDEDFKRFTMLNVTELLNYEKAYLTSFKVLYNALEDGSLPVSDATIEYLFPKPYLAQIQDIDSNIDPLIVLSLIRQESAFNPKARSHVGARGLMQLMPATARELKRGVRNYQLIDPKLNLRLGMKYFKRLLKKYDGNLIYTLAAYNAGEGNLKRWRNSKLTYSDPLVIIESIPFKETRKYVKLIYRNVFFYKYLANDLDFFKLPTRQSFNARSIATAGSVVSALEQAEAAIKR